MTFENIMYIVMIAFLAIVTSNIFFHWLSAGRIFKALVACAVAGLLGILFHNSSTEACIIAMLAGGIGSLFLWNIKLPKGNPKGGGGFLVGNIKKLFSKAGHPVWALVIWFVISFVIYEGILHLGFDYRWGSVAIMVSFFLWPCFLLSKSLINQLLPWMSSNMDGVRKALEPFWTMSNRIDSSKREDNPLFWRVLYTTLFIFWLIIALIAFFCSPWSVSMVYGFGHSVNVVLTNMFASGWSRASVWIWLLLTVAYVAVLWWYITHMTNVVTPQILAQRAIVFGVIFLIRRITTYLLLEYTASMVVSSLIFWGILALMLVIFPVFLAAPLMRLLGKLFK